MMNHSTTHQKIVGYFFILLGFFLFCPNHLSGQIDSLDQFHSIFKELRKEGTLALSIDTDFKKLVKKKYNENYQGATLTFEDAMGKPAVYKAKIRTRGNIRKKVCHFPPLKLKFKKEWLAANGMDSVFNDLKLVVGCKKGNFYHELVLKEYLAYQLYATLTDFHFRTQLVDITIHDMSEDRKPHQTKAFLIENQDEMAFRFNGRCTKPKVMRSKTISEDQLALLTLFQYMIGNTDWAFPNSHNVRFIVTRNHPKVIPIAYDFDYAGLVNAPYAVHRESIGIEDIQTRYFLGNCKYNAAFEKAIPLFLEKKTALYKVVQDFEELNEKDRQSIQTYLEGFFKIIESPKLFQKKILDKCID